MPAKAEQRELHVAPLYRGREGEKGLQVTRAVWEQGEKGDRGNWFCWTELTGGRSQLN